MQNPLPYKPDKERFRPGMSEKEWRVEMKQYIYDNAKKMGKDYYDIVKAEISNLYWKMDVEDNAFVILKDSKSGRVASLHSTMSQWRHLFSLEIFLEDSTTICSTILLTMSYLPPLSKKFK